MHFQTASKSIPFLRFLAISRLSETNFPYSQLWPRIRLLHKRMQAHRPTFTAKTVNRLCWGSLPKLVGHSGTNRKFLSFWDGQMKCLHLTARQQLWPAGGGCGGWWVVVLGHYAKTVAKSFALQRENPRTCLNNGNNDVAALICFGPHSDSMSCTRTSRQSTVGAVRGVAQWVVRWFSGWWGGTATAARVNRMRSVLVLHVARALG